MTRNLRRRLTVAAFALALAGPCLAGGCGGATKTAKPKPPAPYRLSGRVIDAGTGKPIPQARLRFRAVLNTILGPRSIQIFDVADVDGTYRLDVPPGYDVMRAASQIRIDAAQVGYTVAGADIPPPTEKKDVYEVPDIAIAKTKPKAPWTPAPQPPAAPAR